jgi:RND family efflux transporter MFP subunit
LDSPFFDEAVAGQGNPMFAPTSSSPHAQEEGSKAVHAATPPALTKTSRLVALAFALLAIVGLGVGIAKRLASEGERAAARERDVEAQRERADAPPEVETAAPVAFEYDPHFSITGTLDPVQVADVGFNVAGRLVAVDVSLGEHVEAGQILAKLDRRSVTAQTQFASAAVQASQAQLAMAEDRLRRTEALHGRGASSDADLQAAQQQMALAQAQLAQATAQTRLTSTDGSNHILRAPFAGTVTLVPEGVGNVVGPQRPLFRIEDLSSLVLRSGITEHALDRVQIGDAVELENLPVRGKVRAFARSLDPVTRRAPIEIAIDNAEGRLVGHSLVKGSILTARPYPAVRIPGTALRSDRTVLVVDAQDRVEVRPVEALVESDGSGVVLAGLASGDRVVVRPSPDLTPGREVRATAAAEAPETR